MMANRQTKMMHICMYPTQSNRLLMQKKKKKNFRHQTTNQPKKNKKKMIKTNRTFPLRINASTTIETASSPVILKTQPLTRWEEIAETLNPVPLICRGKCKRRSSICMHCNSGNKNEDCQMIKGILHI